MQATLQKTIDAVPAYNRTHAPIYTDKSAVRVNEEVEPQHFLLREGATEFFPKGELIVVSGKLKHGKTHWCEELACSLLGASRFGYEAVQEHCRVLWIDTEQSRYDAYQLNLKVYETAGIDKEKPLPEQPFLLHAFRGFGVDERLRRIDAYLAQGGIDVLFVDGVADLLVNYNDVNESQSLIMDQLLRWCAEYGCAVVCVMHENKKTEDTNLKGHLGTLLGQKMAEQYSVTRHEADGTFAKVPWFNIEMSETRSGHRIVTRQAEFDENGLFKPSRYEKPRFDVELGLQVVDVLRQPENWDPETKTYKMTKGDLVEGLQCGRGGKQNEAFKKMDGFVFEERKVGRSKIITLNSQYN